MVTGCHLNFLQLRHKSLAACRGVTATVDLDVLYYDADEQRDYVSSMMCYTCFVLCECWAWIPFPHLQLSFVFSAVCKRVKE